MKKVQPVCKKWAALAIYNVEVFIYDILLAEVDSSIRALVVARKTLRSDSEHWEINNSRSLLHAVDRLKEKHKKILFARLFGELTFREIGEKFGMTEKQAEAVYFYIITKLRKEMEGKRDEF